VTCLPTVEGVWPPENPPGKAILIGGKNLTGVTAVEFGGIRSPVTFSDGYQLSTVVPEGAAASSVTLRLVRDDGLASKDRGFSILSQFPASAPPELESPFSPVSFDKRNQFPPIMMASWTQGGQILTNPQQFLIGNPDAYFGGNTTVIHYDRCLERADMLRRDPVVGSVRYVGILSLKPSMDPVEGLRFVFFPMTSSGPQWIWDHRKLGEQLEAPVCGGPKAGECLAVDGSSSPFKHLGATQDWGTVDPTNKVITNGNLNSTSVMQRNDGNLDGSPGGSQRITKGNIGVNSICTFDSIRFKYLESGAYSNLGINDELVVVNRLASLHGRTIGGVPIRIESLPNNVQSLVADGPVHDFQIGGEDILLDDFCRGPCRDDIPKLRECTEFYSSNTYPISAGGGTVELFDGTGQRVAMPQFTSIVQGYASLSALSASNGVLKIRPPRPSRIVDLFLAPTGALPKVEATTADGEIIVGQLATGQVFQRVNLQAPGKELAEVRMTATAGVALYSLCFSATAR
jgi:hypothetical protein